MASRARRSTIGKFRGHAAEGHFRGVLVATYKSLGYTVDRDIGRPLEVIPDAVLKARDGRVLADFIVAYWQNSDDSHKKMYRTLTEYQALTRAFRQAPALFSDRAKVVPVLYGTGGGWKASVLQTLEEVFEEVLFLPKLLGDATAVRIIDRAYEAFVSATGDDNARTDAVAEVFTSRQNWTRDEEALAEVISNCLASNKAILGRDRHSTRNAAAVPTPFRTRYRQGLNPLAWFSDEEVFAWRAWRESRTRRNNEQLEAFVRRAFFFDLVRVVKGTTTIGTRGRAKSEFVPRAPERDSPGGKVYAPDEPDFISWEDISAEEAVAILRSHRELAAGGSPFEGGAQDLVMGNWTGFADAWRAATPKLLRSIDAGSRAGVQEVLRSDVWVGAEAFQPCAPVSMPVAAVWSLLATAIATAEDDRRIIRDVGFRPSPEQHGSTRKALAARAVSAPKGPLLELLKELNAFLRLISGPVSSLEGAENPKLLSLLNAESWVGAVYGKVTSNSTHNPLCVPMLSWLRNEYPLVEWQGWPKKRSVRVADLLSVKGIGVEWQFAGFGRNRSTLYLAEPKSVTSNHWADKSKETFSRVQLTRAAAAKCRVTCMIIGALDGDFDTEALGKLAGGDGYDRVLPVTAILGRKSGSDLPRHLAAPVRRRP